MSQTDRIPLGKAGLTTKEIDGKQSLKLERELHRQIVSYLQLQDVWIGKSRFGKRSTFTPGAPDIVFVWKGVPWAFECKIGNEQPTESQLAAHAQMRRNGWIVFVVRTLEEAKEFLWTIR